MSLNADPGRLSRILARLEPEDAVFVQALTAPLRERQAWRHAVRDAAIREALGLLPGKASVQAVELERLIRQYLASAWRFDRGLTELPPETPRIRVLVHTIAVETQGDGLGWRQIDRIAKR